MDFAVFCGLIEFCIADRLTIQLYIVILLME